MLQVRTIPRELLLHSAVNKQHRRRFAKCTCSLIAWQAQRSRFLSHSLLCWMELEGRQGVHMHNRTNPK